MIRLTYRATIAFALAAELLAVPFALADQPVPERSGDASIQESVEPAAEVDPRAPFDLALVGLPGFPYPLATQDDFSRAVELTDARIAELSEAQGGENQVETANAEPDAEVADEGEDPRIAPLRALRLALQRGAALAARAGELDDALAVEQQQLDKIRRQGLEAAPPYPIALLDQLRTERGLIQHAEEMVDRRRAQAQRQLDLAANELEAAMRARRQARDRWAAADAGSRRAEELTLEVARINTLVALQRQDTALVQQTLAQKEDVLAAAQLALLDTRIDYVKDDLVFTQEALESRLSEVQSREEALQAKFETLMKGGEAAELALFEARQRLNQAIPGMNRDVLLEQENAWEEELKIVRKAVEYKSQVAVIADAVRGLLKRRFAVLQGADADQWGSWLRESQELLREVDKDQDFTLAELGALRSAELGLARRLAAPDLDDGVREAVTQRMAALDVQAGLAEEMLLIQDQVRSLAQRLRYDLEPRVRERSFGQRVDQARGVLSKWWDAEIIVFQDQGVHLRDLVTALGVFVLIYVIVWLLQMGLRRSLLSRFVGEAGQGDERRTLRAVVSPLIRHTSQVFVLIVAFYAAMAVSGLAQGKLQEWLGTLLVLALYFQIGIWANAGVVDYFKRKRSRKEREDPSAVSGYGLLLFFLRVGIWIVVGVSVLAHFKYPIAGLIGALGVGGIAVAFAVQNILADVFNSMAIILDKPFRVGDFVDAGGTLGVIEHIGVKTTRIRSLSGEQVVMSNTELLGSCIHNFKQMRERRVVFKIGVVYETPPEKLERIPLIIAEVIRAQRSARFDRAHFAEYGDFSLVFEVVYFVVGADYSLYMDIQQAINLGIYRRFQEEGIGFAYPTQELIVRRTPEPPGPLLGAAT